MQPVTVATTNGTARNYLQRAPSPSGLADVLDVILDKGLVIDAYVRVSVIGIELVTIDARIVIASVDTYLRFAEAVNRLDLQPQEQVAGLPGLMNELQENGARSKTRGALGGVTDSAKEVASSLRGDEAAKALAAGAAIAGATAAAKTLTDRFRGADGD